MQAESPGSWYEERPWSGHIRTGSTVSDMLNLAEAKLSDLLGKDGLHNTTVAIYVPHAPLPPPKKKGQSQKRLEKYSLT